MTASMSWFNFRCSHFQRQQWEYYVTSSWVPYHKHYVIRSFPLVRGEGCSPRTNDLIRQPAVTPPPQNKTKVVPWLSNSSRSELHVLQRRCQPTPTQPILNRGRERGGGEKGCTYVVHGRKIVVWLYIDPRIPTNAGTEHVGFSQAR